MLAFLTLRNLRLNFNEVVFVVIANAVILGSEVREFDCYPTALGPGAADGADLVFVFEVCAKQGIFYVGDELIRKHIKIMM
jgi:hypothetical protein